LLALTIAASASRVSRRCCMTSDVQRGIEERRSPAGERRCKPHQNHGKQSHSKHRPHFHTVFGVFGSPARPGARCGRPQTPAVAAAALPPVRPPACTAPPPPPGARIAPWPRAPSSAAASAAQQHAPYVKSDRPSHAYTQFEYRRAENCRALQMLHLFH
jgi:hypothetical protein